MDQMEIERRKRLAAQMVHPFASGQQMQTIPSAAAQYGPGILKSLAGVPTDQEGAEMDALSGQFQTGLVQWKHAGRWPRPSVGKRVCWRRTWRVLV
jgi:hypothetical protein